jgi:hypothetical protein
MELAGYADGLAIIVDEALNAVAKNENMKINKQTDLKIQQTQMSKKLGFVDGMKSVFAFCFDYYTIFHYQISTEPAV